MPRYQREKKSDLQFFGQNGELGTVDVTVKQTSLLVVEIFRC